METYTFWYENRAGITFVEKRLTKRQAVIRYNRIDRDLPDDVKRYGWKEEPRNILHVA
jgi:hypothetical protein